MRLALRRALLAASLLVLSAGVSVAGAVSGPGANENSKFVYTEEVVSTDLVVNFEEGGQKKFSGVDYRLDATVEVYKECGGQALVYLYSASNAVTALVPDDKGRAAGSVSVEGPGVSDCLETTLLRITYAELTLTNLASGHAYRLDPITQTYP
jgi:hypothetical protein